MSLTPFALRGVGAWRRGGLGLQAYGPAGAAGVVAEAALCGAGVDGDDEAVAGVGEGGLGEEEGGEVVGDFVGGGEFAGDGGEAGAGEPGEAGGAGGQGGDALDVKGEQAQRGLVAHPLTAEGGGDSVACKWRGGGGVRQLGGGAAHGLAAHFHATRRQAGQVT